MAIRANRQHVSHSSALTLARLAACLGMLVLLPQISASVFGPLARKLAPAAPAATASPPASPGSAVPEFAEKEVFFGETHIHTAYSFDAFLGGARLDPTAPTALLAVRRWR